MKHHNLIGIALTLKVTAKRGSFLFCPHGPLLISSNLTYYKALVSYVKELASQEQVSFIRFSPLMLNSEANTQLLLKLGFRNAPIHMHSELVWMLELTPSEEELLANMRKTTRYSIRKASNNKVEVFAYSAVDKVDDFYSLYLETVDRHNFVPFSKEYIKKEVEAFTQNNNALILLGKFQQELISAAIVIFSHGSAFYHHGASKYSKVPVSYLVQWKAIKEAKKRGCKYYNFWGISPENQPNHPWAGLTLFKQGFGGFSEEYLHAQDLVLSPKYWLTYAVEKIRKAKRGL